MENFFDRSYDHTKPADLTTFVTHPYAEDGNIDPVSKIYQTFQATKSSPAIAIFYFFAVMSHWNLLQNVTYKIPKDWRNHSPNLWLMALAHSGASKSQQLALLNELLPSAELKSSFNQPASPASLISQFSENPVHLWVEDEAAKYLKQIETPAHPLSPIKGQLLKIKGGDTLTYHTKKDGETIIKNPRMSIYFVNTILGMMNTISEESMYDGFLSRIGIVLSETSEKMQLDIEKNFPNNIHDLGGIKSSGLSEDLTKIFDQNIHGNQYTFSEKAESTFEKSVSSMRISFMWMQGEENRYKPFFERTVLEAFKYAIFHRQLMLKEGTEVDAFDMEYGLLIARYHLCSFARYLQLSAEKKEPVVRNIKSKIMKHEESLKDKILKYVKSNPKAKLRDVYRAFTIKKSKAEEILAELGITLQMS
ncbi:MAG: hypothetical protein QG594_380 [Bacteroidota bacterium]|nr:hypothetical protein [Bacteroidota bacterium]